MLAETVVFGGGIVFLFCLFLVLYFFFHRR
jgi:hypothetical protein